MPPDKIKIDDKKDVKAFQTYHAYSSAPDEEILPVNAITEEIEAEPDTQTETETGFTYFVDPLGTYYFHPTGGEPQDIVSLPVEENVKPIGEPETQILVEGDAFQTVTLLPSETSTGEVSYVLVVQEEPKPAADIKEEKANSDVYTFEEEEEEGAEEISEDDEPVANAGKSSGKQRGKTVRPQFTCNFCTYTSHRRYLLLRHMKSHSEERPHKCNVCERGFKTVASLQNHVNMHNGVKPHICKYCKSPFTTSGELVRHIRYRHTHEKPHKCTECDYASVELSKLRRHVRCHTGERPYQCPHCTYASPDTFKLKRHLRTHTGEKPYKCDHCNMCFTQSNSLKAHKLIHNVAEKPVYPCQLCPARCGRKTDLRIHVQKLHTSDKPLKCKRCGKTFADRYSCKMHNKTHEGEKCYKCEVCPYASTTLRHLKSHILKHTDEKPFVCDLCDQSFRQKQLLRRHQNLYHNPDYVPKPPKEKTHTCHECNRIFAHKGNLIRHLAVHDPDSGHLERSLALRIGRQKRVAPSTQTRIEEPVVVEDESGDDDVELLEEQIEPLSHEIVTVPGGMGQQYVVLEVIQVENDPQRLAVVSQQQYMEKNEPEQEEQDEEFNQKPPVLLNKVEGTSGRRMVHSRVPKKSLKTEKDVDTCFGFDEEDDPEDDEDIAFNNKVVLRLV